MDWVEVQWLHDEETLKSALQKSLKCSGQLIKKHFSSKQQSHSVRARDITRLPLDFVNNLLINPHFEGPPARILRETEDYLVLHKPPGVHCHPLAYSDRDTLLNFLVQEKKWDALSLNTDHYDRGLLYRLDLETSGVMVVARRGEFLKRMREHFHFQMKKKYYWAIVEGDFNREGSWTHYFRGTGLKGSKQKVSDSSEAGADAGVLSVRKLSFQGGKSLVLVNLTSGLRHQIRAQLSHLGFPLLGDELYGGTPSDRLYLHALRYEWEDVVEDFGAEKFDQFFDLEASKNLSQDLFTKN